MRDLYAKPVRVYLVMAALALWGLLSGFGLPVSLFPKSSQPNLAVSLGYGSLSPGQFLDSIGRDLESKLQAATVKGSMPELLKANYGDRGVRYTLKFGWGVDAEEARKTLENIATSAVANRDLIIRRSLQVNLWSENSGFFGLSFYSPLRSLDEIYDLLSPSIAQIAARVPDATGLELYNPSRKEITVALSPESLALHQLTTAQVEGAVRDAVISLSGGTLRVNERDLQLNIPKAAASVESLGLVRVSPLNAKPVLLKDIAKISIRVSKDSQRKFKTSGVDSLILFASPKEGGNIKQMSEDIMREVEAAHSSWPADIQYTILVNPAEFINRSIMGVLREVGLAALLAVLVLFLFIGSLKNVATAAIEIPLSLVMAFILMKLTGMNLNLISLGGLALSAGMNVDASVVVLENIFRHFEEIKHPLSPRERMDVILGAVGEVRLPIIASTIASLVVFAPLVFTSGLTNALLGDLAKAVIFSHGLSAIVALVLVPTIRYQLMKSGEIAHAHSPIERQLRWLERSYSRTLGAFLHSRRAQNITFVTVIVMVPLLAWLVLPRLEKEVIGKPETDWLIVGLSDATSSSVQQVESDVQHMEDELSGFLGRRLRYTFTQIQNAQVGFVMARLADRRQVEDVLPELEGRYKNTPTLFYWVERWNPSELEIPDPPAFQIEVAGGSDQLRFQTAEDLLGIMADRGVFDKTRTYPSVRRGQELVIEPVERFTADFDVISREGLAHTLRTATMGSYVEDITQGLKTYPIYLRFPEDRVATVSAIKALPIGFEGKLIPVGALAQISRRTKAPDVYRQNQSSLILIDGRIDQSNVANRPEVLRKAREVVEETRAKLRDDKEHKATDLPTIGTPEPARELHNALDQLRTAVLISTALIFLVMVIQLGDMIQALLVMVAIPLGFIGVLVSLFVFRSNLSLNSGLGTILLNGIAVANSIILVDFIQKLFVGGRSAVEATVTASVTRLRPILMTSLTTVLGMLPVALGLGEGGKILQPLGIAVCGGLWVSAVMTLYLVPALQYRYLAVLERRRESGLSHASLGSHDFAEDGPDVAISNEVTP